VENPDPQTRTRVEWSRVVRYILESWTPPVTVCSRQLGLITPRGPVNNRTTPNRRTGLGSATSFRSFPGSCRRRKIWWKRRDDVRQRAHRRRWGTHRCEIPLEFVSRSIPGFVRLDPQKILAVCVWFRSVLLVKGDSCSPGCNGERNCGGFL
jgi:hypothetical protein